MNKRVACELKRIESTTTPTNLFFFDTETKDSNKGKDKACEKHKLWFGCYRAYRLEGAKRTRIISGTFDTIDGFWESLVSRLDKKRTLNVYAHNAAFDLTIIDFWRISEELGWSIEFAVLEAPPVILSISTPQGRFNVIDTLNYFKVSLSKLGESVGLDKLEIDITKANYEQALPYCERDVEILDRAIYSLIDFVRANRLGKLGSTVASLAFSAFRHRFMTHSIMLHDRERVLKLEKESYYGGMVNCLYVGKVKRQTVYKLDVNSLYPTVMLRDYPIKLELGLERVTPKFVLSEMRQKAVIASCLIDTTTEIFPLRRDKELIFPVGLYHTTLAGPELEHAIKCGACKKISYVAIYEKAPIFKEYVEFFWNIRKEYKKKGDDANNTFCKLMLNSLYGKFGQGAYKWSDLNPVTLSDTLRSLGEELPEEYLSYGAMPEIPIGQREWLLNGPKEAVTLRNIGGHTQIRQRTGYHPYSFVAIASYVTSYARRYLMDLLAIADPTNCYYYDTDSLFVNAKGYARLKRAGKLSDTELGGLKLEGTSYEPTFLAPKDYFFGSEYKLKGIRNPGSNPGQRNYTQLQFEGLPSIIKRGGEPYILIKRINKTMRHRYKKGLIDKTGRTKPFTIDLRGGCR